MSGFFNFLLLGKGARRQLHGWESLFVRVIAVGIMMFHVLMLSTGELGWEPFAFNAAHVCSFLILVFLLFSLSTKPEKRISMLSWGLTALSFALLFYLIINVDALGARADMDAPLEPKHIILGIIIAVLVLEATRRVVGMSMVLLTLFFIFYAYYGRWPGIFAHSGISWQSTVNMVALGTSSAGWGIWGHLIWISANKILPIILFGMLMQSTGASKIFLALANALVGRSTGGPAKVAVLGSAAVATITGGAPANVAVTGSFTIPAMIRLGYPRHFAGAVESVASTGGAITPPIVGATVFVMADLLDMSYASLLIPLAIPAFLYYLCIFLQVHWESKKLGLRGLPKKEVPPLISVLKNYELYVFIVPVVFFVWAVVKGWTVRWAALGGIAIILAVYFAVTLIRRRPIRQMLKMILSGVERGAEVTAMVVFAIAVAGIIITSFGESGFAGKFAHLISILAGDYLFIALLFGAILSLLLGMGTAITVAYLTVVLLVIPITIRVGVEPLPAHMFSLYYASMAYITPPVALACYVASSISGANFYRIGWTAMRLAFAAYLAPFLFVYKPALVTLGQPYEIMMAIISTAVALFIFSSVFTGWMFRRLHKWERAIFAIIGIGVLHNDYKIYASFGILFALALIWQYMSVKYHSKAAHS